MMPNELIEPMLQIPLSTAQLLGFIQGRGFNNSDGTLDSRNLYVYMSDLLRQNTDLHFNIKSNLIGNEWVRDATASTPLGDRISHAAPCIEANNALLRCLSRVNAIDYAIGKKHPGEEGLKIRTLLMDELKKLSIEILEIPQKGYDTDAERMVEIDKLETKFNTLLLEKLHEANLTKGCVTAKDAEKLLEHYRNLSSLLVPARTLVTITYDDENRALNRETQYPVTELTEAQRMEIEKIRYQKFSGVKDTAHNPTNFASMEADSLFVELMLKGDRAMPAQTRKSHVILAKNAFIVKNEVAFGVADNSVDPAIVFEERARRSDPNTQTFWLARSGSPVYVGKGKSEEFIQHHTQEILEQIRLCAKKHMGKSELSLHVASLVTDMPALNEDRIVSHIRDATRTKKGGDDYSYMPLNFIGTFSPLSIADSVKSKPSGITPLQKASRLDSAVSVIGNEVIKGGDQIVLVHCASGQDRTGTAVEKAKQQILKFLYRKKYGTINEKNIEIVSAQGGNAAEIASHLSPGSPGMKAQSRANNFFFGRRTFSREVEKELYLDSANTNKSSKILDVRFLTKPSKFAVAEFNVNRENYIAALLKLETSSTLYKSGQKVLKKIDEIAGVDPNLLDSKTLANLSLVLESGSKVLIKPDLENINELVALTEKIHHENNQLYKKIGSVVLKFTAVALSIFAVIAAPFSFGFSLDLIPVACRLYKYSNAISGAGVITKDLANASKEFRLSLEKINDPEVDLTVDCSLDEVLRNPGST